LLTEILKDPYLLDILVDVFHTPGLKFKNCMDKLNKYYNVALNGQITFAYLSTFSSDTTVKSDAQAHV